MLKRLFCLQRPENEPREKWNRSLLELVERNSEALQRSEVCCVDEHVKAAHLLEMKFTQHPKDALVTAWAESLNEFETLAKELEQFADLQSYLVVESNVIALNAKPGKVEGMCQVAFLKRPAAQSREAWMDVWLNSHTQIAIDTQSTFGYRQNIVLSTLPITGVVPDRPWPLMDAIVEENFPSVAMESREAFFNAEGDSEKFERHQKIMMESSFRFIDFENFDCVPMSQHIIK